jgi:hypothetical protein
LRGRDRPAARKRKKGRPPELPAAALPGHDAPRQVAVSTALPWDGLHAQDPFGRILTIDPILKLEYINRFKFFLHFQKGKNIF